MHDLVQVVAAAALPVVQLFGEYPNPRQVMISWHHGYNKEKGSGGQGEEPRLRHLNMRGGGDISFALSAIE